MLQQEWLVAEAPQHADAGQTAVAGCCYIYVTVADVDSVSGFPADHKPQLAKGLINGIGSRFLTDACRLVLANSHLYLRKEVSNEFLGGSHHLVADHRQATTSSCC